MWSLEFKHEWLDSFSPKLPKVINNHYQPPDVFSHPQEETTDFKKNRKPIFDKYRVDLVLQGHDHSYGPKVE